MFQLPALVLTALTVLAFGSSSAEACMPSRDPSSGVVRCPQVRIHGAQITRVLELARGHEFFASVLNQYALIDRSNRTITLGMDNQCPAGAMCALWAPAPLVFKLVRVSHQEEGRIVIYTGTLQEHGVGVNTTVKIIDYSESLVGLVPAMTVIELSTKAVTPRAKKSTSIFLAERLELLPTTL